MASDGPSGAINDDERAAAEALGPSAAAAAPVGVGALAALPQLPPSAATSAFAAYGVSDGETHRVDARVDGGLIPSNEGRLSLLRLDSDPTWKRGGG